MTHIPAMPSDQLVLPAPIPPHHRLLASDADWERLRKQIQGDPVSARIFASLEIKAKRILADPPAERVMVGRRLLGTFRLVLQRIAALAMAGSGDGG